MLGKFLESEDSAEMAALVAEMHRLQLLVDRLRGLLDIFLAHTHRFRDPQDPEAIRYYDRALTKFEPDEESEKEGDIWITAWLLRERGDLEMECGRTEQALGFVARSGALAADMYEEDEEWDHELLADLHRITADVLWSTHGLSAAAPLYSAAVLESYLMQNDANQPPDEYTAQFYAEMASRAVHRMFEPARTSGRREAAAGPRKEIGLDL